MKGIYLHPLRLAALDRLKVLRVPFKVQPKKEAALIDRELLDTKGVYQTWLRNPDGGIDQDFNAQYFKPPYVPGEHYVREAWRQGFAPTKWWSNGIVYKADATKALGMREYSGSKWNAARSMPEEYARYLLTLGPPVPLRLGEVTDRMAIEEGIECVGGTFSCNPWRNYKIGKKGEMNMHCSAPTRSLQTMWDLIYPRHPYSPELWTWGYPMEVRRR